MPCVVTPEIKPYKAHIKAWLQLDLTEGIFKAKASCDEVKPLYRQAPKDHVTEENHLL